MTQKHIRIYTRSLSLTCLLMLMLSSVISCNHADKKAEGQETPQIDVALPEVDSVTLHKTYPGKLSSLDMVDVVGRVNGTLLTKQYSSGQYVTKGQVLFTIEDTKYRDAVAQARASLATAESQLDYATRRHEAMKKALESDAVSQMDVTQAKANMEQAAASVQTARAQLSIANTNLGYCVVRAPISGYISGAALDPGAYVGGEGSPVRLTTIYNDDELIASFDIQDDQYRTLLSVSGGLGNAMYRRVPLEFKTPMSRDYAIDLYYESPAVSATTGTVNLKGKLSNPDHQLKDGMYVTISLPYGTDPQAILINDASIGTDQLGKYVYVVNDSNKVVYTPIKTGELVRDSLRIVTSGLTPKDRYVTKALLTVRNGMKVNPRFTK
ncbi:MAG: efflux RND transporter periplasmic adaptor subunit [Muribaculaceae bacterium]|nr:efflux RND transporter periplasmic adaptor subunit [Muribaculaceae bacterium]